MKRGIIVGKFLPPHLGHSYLIERGAAQCDQLSVLICDRPEYLLPAKLRKTWLETMHPNVTFRIIPDTLDDNDSEAWAANTIAFLGYKPDVVFTSEEYGHAYAKFMGARHILVDQARHAVPVSGTAVRANPWANWQYLHPIVRAYFAKRICLVGAESTGTTTLTKALAKHYHTNWVPEYARAYIAQHQVRLTRQDWKTKDFVAIARGQNAQEDAAAPQANKLLFCDTDALTTTIWHERYMGTGSYQVEALAIGRTYDLYILTDVKTPFVQDDVRDSEAYREWMHQRLIEKLSFWGRPYLIVSGSPTERLEQATQAIDSLFRLPTTIPGLQRNLWHPGDGF